MPAIPKMPLRREDSESSLLIYMGVALVVTIHALWRLQNLAADSSPDHGAPTLMVWLMSAGLFGGYCVGTATFGRDIPVWAVCALPFGVVMLTFPGVVGWVPVQELGAQHSSADIVAWVAERIPGPALPLTLALACAIAGTVRCAAGLQSPPHS